MKHKKKQEERKITRSLTAEEKDILDSYERGEWESVSDVEEEKKRITNIFLESKSRRQNIRTLPNL